ncbi:amidase signature enzyme [Fusarium austroafricanum]|uniref:Amidase signature enzyme n=1 Tax=Fusarium austroafricanum TaxID=2364996 RepID=A0A8H4KAG5_9HYPO|nr:amidase signature enzyme [Fusarium austroafricanum]
MAPAHSEPDDKRIGFILKGPTGDFVNFHAPWNPRGDGVRSPGGSRYGSGDAAGAYDWIDFTIGTDTGGGVRQPAASQSVYGLRPSQEILSVDGTVVIHRYLDAIGVLSSDLDVLRTVSHHLYDSIEKVLAIKKRSVDFRDGWEKFHPNSGQAFAEYFQEVFYEYVVWGQWQERSTFRGQYLAKFERTTYVNPLSRFCWELGSNMTEEHFSKLKSKREEFQDFIEELRLSTNTIVFFPRLRPKSRDKAEFGCGLRAAFQAPMAGQPEIVFPVGQLPVFSTISQREENYGVITSLIGSHGKYLSGGDVLDKADG